MENKTIPETKEPINTLLEATLLTKVKKANEKAPTTSLPEAGEDHETVLKEKAVPKAKDGPEAILKVRKVSETKEDFKTAPEAKEDPDSALKEVAVSERKKDAKTVLVPEALDDPKTVLKESSASETKKDTATTSESNEETYIGPDDDVTKAARENILMDEDFFKTQDERKQRILQKSKSNSPQSGGSLPRGLVLFGGDEDLDTESQSSESSSASDCSDDTRENWDAESEAHQIPARWIFFS
jgi:hypothetical protein